MVFKKEFEFELDYDDFYDFCENCYFDFKETDLLNDVLIKEYFKSYCNDLDTSYEIDAFMENKEKIISEIQSIARKNVKEQKVENKTSMEKEIQNEIENNYNFEDLIRTIMDEYYSQGYQIEKIENQIASACIAKINQISWQKAINALKN